MPQLARTALAALCAFLTPVLAAQVPPRPRAFGPTTPTTTYPIRALAPGVWAILGDSGQGVEGRPNAGFVETPEGVLVVGGLASPAQGRAVIRTIRTVTRRPIRWLMLYAHHPDMQFGASALVAAGAKVIAHPDTHVLAAENGRDGMLAGWVPVVGVEEMLGFAWADTPARPVVGSDTMRFGGKRLVFWHPGAAHSAGDLMLWLPDDGVLFTGDVVVEDALPMVIDGSSRAMLDALDAIEAVAPRVLVPGHGRIPAEPRALLEAERQYLRSLRATLAEAVRSGVPMQRALAALPPAEADRPVSPASRRRRNAAWVYVEMEREVMGVGAGALESAPRVPPAPSLPYLVSSDTLAAWIARGRELRLLDVRGDLFTYLAGHLPGAGYLNIESARGTVGGLPARLLSAEEYAALWARLGLRRDLPVVVYSAGETKNIDATFIAWLLSASGHPDVGLLDGGYFKWMLEQRPVARTYPRWPTAGPWARFAPRVATLEEVRQAQQDGRTLLLDARPPEQFRGEAGSQMRRGHIPGAVNHYWQDDLQTEGFGRVFKPVEVLRTAYLAQGATPDRPIILYCNSATEASHLWFALVALLGYQDVRIYAGSWTEWAERTDLPVATGP